MSLAGLSGTRSGLLLTIVLGTFLVGSGCTSPDEYGPPVLLTGWVAEADDAAADLSRACFMFSAGPTDDVTAAAEIGDELPSFLLPVETSTDGTSFTFRLDPAEVPDDFVNDNRVHVEADVIAADGSWMASIVATVLLVRDPDDTPHWIDPMDTPDWSEDGGWSPQPIQIPDIPAGEPPSPAVIEALKADGLCVSS